MIKEASVLFKQKSLCLILALVLFCGRNCLFAQLTPAKIIPDFIFYDLNGQSFTQKQIKSSNRILFLFFDATCTHCQYEMQLIGSHYNDFKKTDFYIISMDQKQQIQKFMATYGKQLYGKKNVTVLVDSNRQFIQRFLPSRFPALYIYNAKHQLLKYWDTSIDINEVLNVIYAP
jgi:peroxiredoxin